MVQLLSTLQLPVAVVFIYTGLSGFASAVVWLQLQLHRQTKAHDWRTMKLLPSLP